MSMNVIPIAELEPNDPRRWTKPTWNGCFASLHEELWDNGLIIADAEDWIRVHEKRGVKFPPLPSVAELKRNYGRWLPRTIRASPTTQQPIQNYKRKVDDSALFLNHDFAPKRRSMACVVDDSALFLNHDFAPKRRSMPCVASAPSSSPLGCSGCGITHWKRLCPNPVPRSLHSRLNINNHKESHPFAWELLWPVLVSCYLLAIYLMSTCSRDRIRICWWHCLQQFMRE